MDESMKIRARADAAFDAAKAERRRAWVAYLADSGAGVAYLQAQDHLERVARQHYRALYFLRTAERGKGFGGGADQVREALRRAAEAVEKAEAPTPRQDYVA